MRHQQHVANDQAPALGTFRPAAIPGRGGSTPTIGTRRQSTTAPSRLRRWVGASAAVILVAVLAGCGTAVVDNTFAVSFQSASPTAANQPAAGPIRVSVFDNQMGTSAEWAEKSMGTSAPGQPYVTTVSTTATKMIGDNSPAPTVRAGLAVPAVTDKGYFALNLMPVSGQSATVTAPFVGYYAYSPQKDGPIDPLVVSVRSTADGANWMLELSVMLPSESTNTR